MKAAICTGIVCVFFLSAGTAFADTLVAESISESTTWTKEGSPYLVEGVVSIGAGVTLSIEPEVVVHFAPGSSLKVHGAISAQGTEDAPIALTAPSGSWSLHLDAGSLSSTFRWVEFEHLSTLRDDSKNPLTFSDSVVKDSDRGILVSGGTLFLERARFERILDAAVELSYGSTATLAQVTLHNVDFGIQIYQNSHASISDFLAEGVSSQVIAVYVGSSARVASSTIRSISDSSGAVMTFVQSSIEMRDARFDTISDGPALAVYDQSSLTVQDATITNTDAFDAIEVADARLALTGVRMIGGTGDALVTFNGGKIEMRDSIISEFPYGAGVADYGSRPEFSNELALTNTEITQNDTGISTYGTNSLYTLSQNKIADNTSGGLVVHVAATIDATDNFWGDVSGPYNDPDNLGGTGNAVEYVTGSTVQFSPWLTSWGVATSGFSNVLFLPGIEGSRLYRPDYDGGTEKLWEPAGDTDMKDLYLNADGTSARFDIYAKERDVIEEIPFGGKIYDSLVAQMDALKADGTINDWEPIAYDWRLSLDDILAYGNNKDGRIYYSGDLRATSTPYVLQELRRLAASSKSGKVTIVAHSNGGLLAKALLKKLGSAAPTLVDKVIMVGAPQSGAPESIGALLYGYNQGISFLGFSIVHEATARALAQNAPMAYHLLPSEYYLESTMGDAAHPVIRFSGNGYTKEFAAYGATIANRVALADFLLAKEGGREKPEEKDVKSAEILNADLIDYANRQHAALDFWTPPDGIKVDQIAGWGIDTLAGINFYSPPGKSKRLYKPIFVEDGDGTVTVPSAIMMASSTAVKRYWVDLAKINNIPGTKTKFDHKNLFEIPLLKDFIQNSIREGSDPLPNFITVTQPESTSEKKLIFFLHSPLTLQATDSLGNITGLAVDGSVTEDIPSSTYGELGELKYLIVPESGRYELTLYGQDTGTFTLDIEESVGGVVATSSSIADVPVTPKTSVRLNISGGLDTASTLRVDEDGDGREDLLIGFKAGETVSYEPPAQAPPVPEASSGGGAGAISIPVIATTTATVALSPVITHPPATSTTTKKVAQTKKTVTVATTTVKKAPVNVPQTASALDAVSQQSWLKKVGAAVYNGAYGLWTAFKKLF
ncbi:MAG: right-handed parallel beta-helix repeat-containing protein [Patescibacteria group bacterium]